MTSARTQHLEGNHCPRRLLDSPWPMGVLIVLATAVAYSNSLGGPFIFDDVDSILGSATIQHLWPLAPVLAPPSEGGRTVAGRPVINLSLALNYAISGTDVWSYHALNVLVHMLAALTLWGVVRRTLCLPCIPTDVRSAADRLATVIAMLWALHPLATAAVTYTIQRAESIMALFYLLALYCAIRSAGSPRPIVWYAGAVAAAAAGMASKEVMATAPVVVLLYDRIFLAGSFARAARQRWILYTCLATTWLVLLALHGGRGGSAGFGGPIGVWSYALTQFDFVVRYLRLGIWPSSLVLDYGTPLVSGVRAVLPQIAVVVGLVMATVAALYTRPALGFLGVWFLVILAPSSSFVPVSTQTGAEHRMYLPLAAVVTAMALAVYWIWRRWMVRIRPKSVLSSSVAALLFAAVAVALGFRTFQRNRDYRSGIAIWSNTAINCPGNPRAHYNLGRHYVEAGIFTLAREEFLRTVQLKPDYPDGFMNLGCSNAKLGRHEEAMADFDQAILVSPEKANNYYNRACSLYDLGRFEEAIADCNAAIARDTRHAEAYYERALAQGKLKRPEESLASYSEAIRLKPDYRDAYGERAIAYYNLKRYHEAWADLRMFQKLGGKGNPKFVELLSRASGRTE